MFIVRHINFDTFREFSTLAEAIEYAKKACFEATITRDGQWYASFSPISGLHRNPSTYCL